MASESTIFRIQSLILLETLLTRGLSARISLFCWYWRWLFISFIIATKISKSYC